MPDSGRVVALDPGEVRTGVAISDSGGMISRPLEVVSSEALSEYLRELVREQGVEEVVVGVPRTLGGEAGYQAQRVFGRLDDLKREIPGVRFVEWDERLTTRIAAGASRPGGKKQRVDHLAAAWMLQEYLDSRGSG